MKKTKIAHIQLLPLLSGVQNVMLNILQGLDHNKYDIYVISKPNGPLVKRTEELGYTHLSINSFRRKISIYDVKAMFELLKLFKKYRFDIVHTHSSKSGFLGRIAARVAKIPKIIHTVHGFPFHPYQKKHISLFYQAMEKIAAIFCDKVVFVNNAEREDAIAKNIVKREKAITIYNGIEIPKTKQNKRKKNDIFVIGSCLRFWEQKNILATIKVAIQVCQKNKNINFIFVGDGEFFGIAKKMVEDSGFNKRIQLPGWKSNIDEWLQKFDVFLLYSKWEGLPLSILEAMSYGLPIIASDIKGNNELVSKDNGILVPINDVDKLTAILLLLSTQKDQLISMKNNSVKIVKKKFSLKKFIESYLELYEKKI
jgi:glycosyltransferase involved in cell wall biosynthesis